ncbi:hypothetical protein KX928_15750 [Roseobacter sp. YSTF-M11]|uniref:Uncharacterized protein n=1 Tax=Roseobacter insulae TaxID=2859783 RepID=A0A9X1JZF6_9RHOB|nr:hypothetical protein [Roseobacter insulae]MBW4709245.1 hypothetical protein [Roseobacter insulae]
MTTLTQVGGMTSRSKVWPASRRVSQADAGTVGTPRRIAPARHVQLVHARQSCEAAGAVAPRDRATEAARIAVPQPAYPKARYLPAAAISRLPSGVEPDLHGRIGFARHGH